MSDDNEKDGDLSWKVPDPATEKREIRTRVKELKLAPMPNQIDVSGGQTNAAGQGQATPASSNNFLVIALLLFVGILATSAFLLWDNSDLLDTSGQKSVVKTVWDDSGEAFALLQGEFAGAKAIANEQLVSFVETVAELEREKTQSTTFQDKEKVQSSQNSAWEQLIGSNSSVVLPIAAPLRYSSGAISGQHTVRLSFESSRLKDGGVREVVVQLAYPRGQVPDRSADWIYRGRGELHLLLEPVRFDVSMKSSNLSLSDFRNHYPDLEVSFSSLNPYVTVEQYTVVLHAELLGVSAANPPVEDGNYLLLRRIVTRVP